MSFVGPDGQPSGYSVDLCRAIAARRGQGCRASRQSKIQYYRLRWTTASTRWSSGKVDIECATTTITLARMQKVDFTQHDLPDRRQPAGQAGLGHPQRRRVWWTRPSPSSPGTTADKALRDGARPRAT